MIVDWIESHIDSKIKYTGDRKEIHICCPVCGETRFRLYINLESGALYCHNCQFKGTIVNLVQTIEKIPYDQAQKEFQQIKRDIPIANKLSETLTQKFLIPEFKYDKRSISLPDEYQPLQDSINLTAQRALKYLRFRSITDDQILKHQMGICSSGEYINRVIIPIFLEEKLKFWVARAIDRSARLKEKSPATEEYQFSKSEVIFNLDGAIKKYHSIVISEGIFDALSWGDIGISLLGKVLYSAQLDLLLEYKNQITEGVYIALDADAFKSATMMAETLSKYFSVYMINIPEEFDDPNNYLRTHSRNAMWSLIAHAEEYSEFLKISRNLQFQNSGRF